MHQQLLFLVRNKQGRSHTGQRDQIPVRSFGYACTYSRHFQDQYPAYIDSILEGSMLVA